MSLQRYKPYQTKLQQAFKIAKTGYRAGQAARRHYNKYYKKPAAKAGPKQSDPGNSTNATFQDHYAANIYRNRRTSKKKLRKIRYAKRQELWTASRKHFKNTDNWTISSPAVNKQQWTHITLYPTRGQPTAATNPSHADIFTISSELNPTANIRRGSKYMFDTAVCKFDLINNSVSTIEVTMYTYKCRKNIPFSTSGSTLSIVDYFTTTYAQQTKSDGTAITTTVNDLGITPFDSPQFCQNILVTNIKKISLSPAQCYSQTVKDYKNKFFDGDEIEDFLLNKRASWGYLISFKGVSNGTDTPVVPLTLVTEKTYNVKTHAEQVTTINTFT